MRPQEPPAELRVLLRLLDVCYEKKAWHGPNLRGAIRGLDLEAADWRPGPARHSIREIVVHAAYWKYAVRRRLLGEKRGSFPLKGSNWFPRPGPETAAAWRADVALLDAMHRAMREAVSRLPASALATVPPGSSLSRGELIAGAAAHDAYHAGQIQLLKRLHAAAKVPALR
jgi:uncharacterized damage-inducible protein DinB